MIRSFSILCIPLFKNWIFESQYSVSRTDKSIQLSTIQGNRSPNLRTEIKPNFEVPVSVSCRSLGGIRRFESTASGEWIKTRLSDIQKQLTSSPCFSGIGHIFNLVPSAASWPFCQWCRIQNPTSLIGNTNNIGKCSLIKQILKTQL